MAENKNLETLKKAELIEEIVAKDKAHEEYKKEQENKMTELNGKIAQLTEMFSQVMNNGAPQATVISPMQEEEYFIGIHSILPDEALQIPNGVIELKPEEMSPVTAEDIRQIIKRAQYKKLLENGILYFENPDTYSKFRIRRRKELDDKVIIDLVNDKENFKSELVRLTDNKKNLQVTHYLQYRIAHLFKNNQVQLFDMKMLEIYAEFFGKDLEGTMKMLRFVEE